MKKIICVFQILVLCTSLPSPLSALSGPPWIKYTVGYNYILRGIDFPSGQNDIGFTAGESLTYQGDGIVLKTTDGGTTWTPVWTGANEGVEGSCFVDLDHGFIAGWPKFANGWSGFGKTTDGGTTWTSLPVDLDLYYFTDVVFRDANHGILTGATNTDARVWVTSNGGSSWSIASGLAGVPYHACYVSGNTYFLADNAGHIQKSTNGGLNWTTVFNQNGLLLTGIDFCNDTIGMACGDNGVIVKTYDGGVTWTVQTVGVDIWHDFGWETPDHVYVCGTPEIVYESADGGATWGNGFPGSSHQAALYECTFTANGTGFICGSQGTLLKRLPDVIAKFTASATSVCTGDSVTFTDESTGGPLTYQWSFEGGTPSSSTLPNPVVAYNTSGVFDVQLIVSNGSAGDTLLKANYITVRDTPPAPVITANGYTLSSDAPAGNHWYYNGLAIPGATGQEYTASQSGWYWDVVTQNGCSSDTSNNIYLLMAGTQERSGAGIIISPVPNDGRFSVTVSGAGESNYSLTVYSNLGMKVYEDCLILVNGTGSKMIDLHSFPSGLYFIELENNAGRMVRKMIISR
jgi:photosystem II stability/assembly factor-like uncharacterized protein